ncbi:MAG: hypothetical protein GEU75_10490, partial [Dehalococcoidia bacterium]|nr:hypothetical protein [Dehalococcoidia bacterium]
MALHILLTPNVLADGPDANEPAAAKPASGGLLVGLGKVVSGTVNGLVETFDAVAQPVTQTADKLLSPDVDQASPATVEAAQAPSTQAAAPVSSGKPTSATNPTNTLAATSSASNYDSDEILQGSGAAASEAVEGLTNTADTTIQPVGQTERPLVNPDTSPASIAAAQAPEPTKAISVVNTGDTDDLGSASQTQAEAVSSNSTSDADITKADANADETASNGLLNGLGGVVIDTVGGLTSTVDGVLQGGAPTTEKQLTPETQTLNINGNSSEHGALALVTQAVPALAPAVQALAPVTESLAPVLGPVTESLQTDLDPITEDTLLPNIGPGNDSSSSSSGAGEGSSSGGLEDGSISPILDGLVELVPVLEPVVELTTPLLEPVVELTTPLLEPVVELTTP